MRMIEQDQRYAAQDAPNPEEMDALYAATFERADERQKELEDRFIVISGGRLTFRRAEMLHFNASWVDPVNKMIEIPAHDECSCPYCVAQAQEYAENNDTTVEEALQHYWSPKTRASNRHVYYGWSEQTIDAVERFALEVGSLDMAPKTINNRLDALAEYAGIERNLYPHALRAASAMFFADLGIEAYYLQALMGWTDLDVAVSYLQASGVQIARRLNRAFAVAGFERPDPVPEEDLLPTSTEQPTTPGFDPVPPSVATLDEFAES